MANLTGGLSGAASGAALGTAALPGIGTAIGAGIGGLIGLFGGGGDDTKPQLPPITDPVTGAQIAQAGASTQTGLAQQQAFVNALSAQNGVGNQSQVYNQLQGIANGTGPNPAQAQLAQATGANVSNQAALMAGQRGAGANAGLIARQAAQQGATTQQNVIGQAATLQAQQSLNAIGQAGTIAGQQVGQQQNAIAGYNQAAQNNQGQLLGAQSQYNSALTSGQGNVNSNNQNVANNNLSTTGGLLSGLGTAATALNGAFGSSTPSSTGVSNGALAVNQAPQGAIDLNSPQFNSTGASGVNLAPKMAEGGPVSAVGRHLKGMPQLAMAHGGAVPALVSPGEVYVSPDKVNSSNPMKEGEKIPGKPKVGGAKDSYKNDTVPKTLESGGIVIPRHITQGADAPKKAAEFVRAVMAKQGLRR